MEKSPDAFRTISEVAETLDTPTHVLRFWESRFPQIRPVKRAGGRRYYRPSDVALLAGIKRLLHDEGMTIRGVQKILREQGIRHVARIGNGGAAFMDEGETLEAQLSAALGVEDAETLPPAEAETAQIIALETVLNRVDRAPAAPVADAGVPPQAPAADGRAQPPQAPAQPDLWSVAAPDPEPQPDAPEAPMVELAESEESVVVTTTFSGTGPESMPETEPESAVEPAPDRTVEPPVEPQDHDLFVTAEAGPATLAARLRALPPAALADRAEKIGTLQDRILSLRARLAETSRRRGR